MKMANYLRSLSKPEIEDYKNFCNFSDEDIKIIDGLVKGKSWVSLEMELSISETTLYKRVSDIKRKMEAKDAMVEKIPIWEKINLTIKEAAEYSNIGINRINELAQAPNCTFVLFVGNKKLIKRKAFEEFLKNQFEL